MNQGFQAVLVPTGIRSTDDREIDRGALSWRALPLPLMFQPQNAPGHDGARIAGQITDITYDAVSGEYRATGTFDAGVDGQEAFRMVGDQTMRFISVDLEILESEFIEEGNCQSDGLIILAAADDCRIIMRVLSGQIMGATITPFPAFPQAVIVPEGATLPDAPPPGDIAGRPAPVLAHALTQAPDAAWFKDPQLPSPTALTITDDGRVYGHAALWTTCHIGRSDVCLTPPRSAADYSFFTTGATKVQGCDCEEIPTGAITVGTGHAPMSNAGNAAAAHYDDTGTAVADVAAGEDSHGIWVAGALRPGATPEQVQALRGSALSGDWRAFGGNLELVALLAVNVPGFPVVRGRVASGKQTALVAAGGRFAAVDPAQERFEALERRLEAVERVTNPLRGEAAKHIVARASLRVASHDV